MIRRLGTQTSAGKSQRGSGTVANKSGCIRYGDAGPRRQVRSAPSGVSATSVSGSHPCTALHHPRYLEAICER